MNITVEKLENLIHPERNVRKHPENQIKEMMRSVEKFGQIRPVVIDENNEILAGNGLAMALRELNIEDVNVLRMESLSESEKKKLMIADNRIYSLGFDDSKTVMELIAELDDFEVPGYDSDLLEEIMGDMDSVDETIDNFGVLSDEEEKGIENGAESNRKAIERVEALRNDPTTPRPDPSDNEPQAPYQPVQEQTVPTQRSVTCPHCGETLWL